MLRKARIGFVALAVALSGMAGLAQHASADACYPSICPGSDALLVSILSANPLTKKVANNVSVVGHLQGDASQVTTTLDSQSTRNNNKKKGRGKSRRRVTKQNPVIPGSVTIGAASGEFYTILFNVTPFPGNTTLHTCTTAVADINTSNDCGSVNLKSR